MGGFMDNDVKYALLKLKSSVTFKKDLLKKGGLYPPQQEDLQIEIEILESAIKQIIEKFAE
jgi:hypothetical protein